MIMKGCKMKRCFDCKHIIFHLFNMLICKKNMSLKNSKNCQEFEENILPSQLEKTIVKHNTKDS